MADDTPKTVFDFTGTAAAFDTALDASVAGSQLPVEQLRAQAEGYLHRVAERSQQQVQAVQTQAVLGQHHASAILEAA